MPVTNFPTAALPYKYHLKYPVARTSTRATKIQQFEGDAEVRWVSQLPVVRFTLVYNDIDLASVIILREFFESQIGASTSVFTLTLDQTYSSTNLVYNNLLFDTDEFSAIQSQKPNLWTVELPMRQTRAS